MRGEIKIRKIKEKRDEDERERFKNLKSNPNLDLNAQRRGFGKIDKFTTDYSGKMVKIE
jgi:hypothetical protein